jgi:hypothetical protein
MKKLLLLMLALLLSAGLSQAQVMTTLDFEAIPELYHFHGGGQNLGEYYDGVRFGPLATILENPYGYYGTPVATHSGDAVLFSSELYRVNVRATMGIYTDYIGFYYNSSAPIQLRAYDEYGLLTSVTGDANSGNPMQDILEISWSSPIIERIEIQAYCSSFMLDDFKFNNYCYIPEPTTVMLMGMGLIGLYAARSRRRKK